MRRRQPWERQIRVSVQLSEWEAQLLASREIRRLLEEDLGARRDDLLTEARWLAWSHETVSPSLFWRRLRVDQPTAELLVEELVNEGTLAAGPGDAFTVLVRPVKPPPDEWFISDSPARSELDGSSPPEHDATGARDREIAVRPAARLPDDPLDPGPAR
jgi:hypothetical protein